MFCVTSVKNEVPLASVAAGRHHSSVVARSTLTVSPPVSTGAKLVPFSYNRFFFWLIYETSVAFRLFVGVCNHREQSPIMESACREEEEEEEGHGGRKAIERPQTAHFAVVTPPYLATKTRPVLWQKWNTHTHQVRGLDIVIPNWVRFSLTTTFYSMFSRCFPSSAAIFQPFNKMHIILRAGLLIVHQYTGECEWAHWHRGDKMFCCVIMKRAHF